MRLSTQLRARAIMAIRDKLAIARSAHTPTCEPNSSDVSCDHCNRLARAYNQTVNMLDPAGDYLRRKP